MKGKLFQKILPDSQRQSLSCSQSCDSKLRRYSKPFMDLMQKAIHQIKNKQIKQKRNQSFSSKSYQSFVHGLFPTHQKKISHKPRNSQRSQIIVNFNQDLCPIQKIQSISTRNEENDKIQVSEEKQKKTRYKQNFQIKQRKAVHIYKKPNQYRIQTETKISQKECNCGKQGKKSQKIIHQTMDKLLDQHIEPWSTIQDNWFSNKYQFS